MADKNLVMQAIEPHTMSLPAMDRPSVLFAWALDNFTFESDDIQMWLVCGACSERVCSVEEPDTLRVILNTALAHGC